MTEKQVCVFDVTLALDAADASAVKKSLRVLAAKWVFQGEQAQPSEKNPDGWKHWQIRLSLHKAKRLHECIKFIKGSAEFWRTCRVQVTSTKAAKARWSYVMKLDSRIEGPYTDQDDEEFEEPWHVKEFETLLPWQQFIWDTMGQRQKRLINFLYCPTGNIGKSILVMKARCAARARMLPPVNDYKDVMRMVCSMPVAKCYLIDVPRALPKKEKMHGFWAAIESLKDGYAWDDRYSFQERIFGSPVVWVFSNTQPDPAVLSPDRWSYWHVKGGEMLEGLGLPGGEEQQENITKKRKLSE